MRLSPLLLRLRPVLLVALLILAALRPLQAGQSSQYFSGPGGMSVYLLENHANPMVEMRLLSRGGAAHDPPGKAGLAAISAWMFNEGSTELTSSAFHERLDFHGIHLGATANVETLQVNLTTRTEHLDEALARLADLIFRPRMEEKDWQRAVLEQKASIIKAREQPQTQASLRMYQLLFPDHPYGSPLSGTIEGLSNITLEDVRERHVAMMHAPHLILAVAGAISRAQLESLLRQHLAALDPTPSPLAAIPPVAWPPQQQSSSSSRQEHIEFAVPQTTLMLATLGISRHDPDYYPFYVLNQILGGAGLSSRLNREIREKRGLTYGVYSRFSPLSQPGAFIVVMKTKNASSNEALQLLRQELQKMADSGVSAEELQEAIEYLTGSFPLHLDGLGKLAATWATIGYFQLGEDYLQRWPERIRQVTEADILRVAKRILDLSQFYTVTVGKAPS
ncbi:M16 family metallopeptidase [Candidatus Magnetaquicoccus inordinatus]|uniref:M16 family metallopeptidase n=1 Tax=Candidatus Magnetaquicoccus inordinatus TaxID=2496818 RepID=UPI00102CF746|nr:pitrilysin family protein [Candidatus Magnetaquicoccus inordinatus]